MDFVFMLHSHLPYVLNHGRWPHGSDWISEAAIDTYLPLLEVLRGLEQDGVAAPVTIGFTPVLANQLANPLFADELEAFLAQRLEACDEAATAAPGRGRRAPAAACRLLARAADPLPRPVPEHRRQPGASAFRALEAAGRLEIVGSAATHGFLPLLARDESIRLQLAVGVAEHRRLFGRAPEGCWLPECAYRPRGPWHPLAHRAAGRHPPRHRGAPGRRGLPLLLRGRAPRRGGQAARRLWRPRHRPPRVDRTARGERRGTLRSPYRAYRVSPARGADGVAAYVRDPRASMQVWSRQEGYPGEGRYLEFHKIRWPGGLKLWRVTGDAVDLGAKEPYDPSPGARRRREAMRTTSAGLLRRIAATRSPGPRRRDRGAVRHRAVRPLVGRGSRLPRQRLSRARGTARGAAGHRLAAPPATTRPAPPSAFPPARGAPTATTRCG